MQYVCCVYLCTFSVLSYCRLFGLIDAHKYEEAEAYAGANCLDKHVSCEKHVYYYIMFSYVHSIVFVRMFSIPPAC